MVVIRCPKDQDTYISVDCSVLFGQVTSRQYSWLEAYVNRSGLLNLGDLKASEICRFSPVDR